MAIDPLLTVKEVAAILKMKPNFVRGVANSGDLVGVRMGRHWRFTREAVRDFIRKGGSAGESPVRPRDEEDE